MLVPSAAMLVSLSGIGLLYACWRGLLRRRPLRVIALGGGWALQLVALALWTQAMGAEIGVSLGLLAMAPLAWLPVAVGASNGPANVLLQPPVALRRPALPALVRQTVRALAVLALAGAAAALAAVAVTGLLPWQAANRFALAILLVPVLWGLGAYWICADIRWWRPVGVLACVLGVSAGWLWR